MRSGLLTVLGATLSTAVVTLPLYASETDLPGSGDTPSAVVEGDTAGGVIQGPALSASQAVEEQVVSEEPAVSPPEAGAVVEDPVELAVEGDTGLEAPAAQAASTDPDASGSDDEGSSVDAASGSLTATEPMAQEAAPAVPMTLGEIGYDEQGRPGRIHVVVPGDTLWDISDAYLGTPWVWPSVWTDNREIENPHLIVPGDRIWISAYEMRRVTLAEAQKLLAGRPAGDEPPAAAGSTEVQDATETAADSASYRVSSNETSGLITAAQLESAASVVEAVSPRVMLSQGDRVYIGLGADDVSVGDQFTVFRTREKVFDPDTNRLLGYHVDLLGWVEVEEPDAESSLASIRMSASEIQIGDRVIPREPPVLDIEVGPSPEGVEGKISFFPSSRVMMGTIDYVYLNRGELDGLAVGSPLEVYRRGWTADEPARHTEVEVPDRVIAELLVVRTQPQTAVALVTATETELELGDQFRGAGE